MMVQRQAWRCQWTTGQLATVLLPLPPFMVATVMIELVTDRLPRASAKATNHQDQYYRFSGELPTSGNPQPRDGRSLRPAITAVDAGAGSRGARTLRTPSCAALARERLPIFDSILPCAATARNDAHATVPPAVLA